MQPLKTQKNNMKRVWEILAGLSLALVGLLSLTTAAKADSYQTYDLAWSGAAFGNTSSATGVITLDLSTLPNPESNPSTDIISDIQSLTVTVTGASLGNGTWTKADLAPDSFLGTNTYWFTNGATLNMEGDVLAQLIADGGDFNLFFAPPGPQGSNVLTLATDALAGDLMSMTEFARRFPSHPRSSSC